MKTQSGLPKKFSLHLKIKSNIKNRISKGRKTMKTSNKAVITVIGTDAVGIIAKVSGKCSEYGVNILDITQKVYDTTFAMIMLVDASKINVSFSDFVEIMKETGNEMGVVIRATHEDLFNAMHRI